MHFRPAEGWYRMRHKACNKSLLDCAYANACMLHKHGCLGMGL